MAALSLSAFVEATSLIAPSFEELIAQADAVFESEVIDAQAHLLTDRDGEMIVTDVRFRVDKVLKGAPASTVVLQFLGGEVGDVGLRVDGVPRFVRGDRDVLFARTAQGLASPLVGMMHGRVRISGARSTSVQYVQFFDRTPLRDVTSLGARTAQPAFSSRPAMSLAAFESAVAGEVARQAAERKGRQ
ncbi:MAG TPA: hypothetical protein VKD69_17630 [Vicinamibacterales bacterium]|nr:hypothetical protein [Vicinamibacterales bacterium]